MSTRKGANYHLRCTGDALVTADAHSDAAKADECGEAMTLFAANFCPFVQRVWIALAVLDVAYEYVEVDPYKKPKALLDVNPKGLVPALRLGDEGKCLAESTVILEYLHDRYITSIAGTENPVRHTSYMPLTGAYDRAKQRLACDKVNRTLVPSFYRYLQAQEPDKQVEFGKEYVDELRAFEKGMLPEKDGVLWDGTSELSLVDIMLAPWIVRSENVLRFYRGLELDKAFDEKSRFTRYVTALLNHPAVKATTSTDDLYLDSYARYVCAFRVSDAAD